MSYSKPFPPPLWLFLCCIFSHFQLLSALRLLSCMHRSFSSFISHPYPFGTSSLTCVHVCVCVFECACVFCISICSLSAVHLCSKYESVRLSGCLHVCVCVCVISLWSKGMAQLPVQLIRLSESLCPYFAKTNTQKCRDTGREKHPGHFTHSCAKQNTSDPRYKTSKTSDYWHRHTHLCNLTCGKLHLFSLFINLHPADYLTFKLKLILKTMFTLNQRTKRETTDSMLKTDPPSYKWGAGIHKTVNTTLLLAVYPGVFCSSCFVGLTT